MKIPKIEDVQENLIWIFEFFFIGYFALFCVFGTYFLGYDVTTRIVLSVIASYALFRGYIGIAGVTFFTLWNREFRKESYRDEKITTLIDVESDVAILLNLILFTIIKTSYIFGFLQYSITSILIILILILVIEPIIGLIDGYSVYSREIKKLELQCPSVMSVM